MIKEGMCLSAVEGFLRGIHQENHVFKMALYDNTAKLTPETEFYTDKGEITSDGYTKGGLTLTGIIFGRKGKKAWMNWGENAVWKDSNIRARAALIYNETAANKSLCVIDLGELEGSRNGNFSIKFPPLNSNESFITLSI